ncbi:hypothetical protein MMC30_001034 [Trapelia coarctata]|nr:hypothetical protein [Trapelia coarctata]
MHVCTIGPLGLNNHIGGQPLGGTAWLSSDIQHAIQVLGYLGLIALVFEGGLLTSPAALFKAATMSIAVATIGLLAPIALSFLLLYFPFSTADETEHPSAIAGFSAGAALCSTSLGTTFSILGAAKMPKTRLGVVLVGAAMMDDVVGLIMVNIVTILGKGEVTGWDIAKPIVASFGLLVVTIVFTPFFLVPFARKIAIRLRSSEMSTDSAHRRSWALNRIKKLCQAIPHIPFLLSILVLIIFLTIAAFIDASLLLAAFLAGGFIDHTWSSLSPPPESDDLTSPSAHMYERYYGLVVDHMLAPFFFVGHRYLLQISVPQPDSPYPSGPCSPPPPSGKGIVYALIMIFAKLLVGAAIYVEFLLSKPLPLSLFRKKKKASDANNYDDEPASRYCMEQFSVITTRHHNEDRPAPQTRSPPLLRDGRSRRDWVPDCEFVVKFGDIDVSFA